MTISGRQAVCTARTRAFTRTASEKQPAVASVHIGGSGASAPSSAVTFCQDMLLFRALGKLLRGFQRRVAAGYGQANLPCRLGGAPPEVTQAWEQARHAQSSARICVEHAAPS